MRPSRARGGLLARTVSRRALEERLDTLIRRSGEEAVNRMRDEVHAAGPALGLEDEAAGLDALIGALLGTRHAELSAPAAIARRRGRPFDPDRLVLFRTLHAALRDYPPLARLRRARLAPASRPNARRRATRHSPSTRPTSPTSSRAPSSQSRRLPTSSFAGSFPTSVPRTPTTCSAPGVSFPTRER